MIRKDEILQIVDRNTLNVLGKLFIATYLRMKALVPDLQIGPKVWVENDKGFLEASPEFQGFLLGALTKPEQIKRLSLAEMAFLDWEGDRNQRELSAIETEVSEALDKKESRPANQGEDTPNTHTVSNALLKNEPLVSAKTSADAMKDFGLGRSLTREAREVDPVYSRPTSRDTMISAGHVEDLLKEGEKARLNPSAGKIMTQASGQSIAHILRAYGWVKSDLQLALMKKDSVYLENMRACQNNSALLTEFDRENKLFGEDTPREGISEGEWAKPR